MTGHTLTAYVDDVKFVTEFSDPVAPDETADLYMGKYVRPVEDRFLRHTADTVIRRYRHLAGIYCGMFQTIGGYAGSY